MPEERPTITTQQSPSQVKADKEQGEKKEQKKESYAATMKKQLAALIEAARAGNQAFLVVEDKGGQQILRISLTVLVLLAVLLIFVAGIGFSGLFIGLAVLLVLLLLAGSRVRFEKLAAAKETQEKQGKILWEKDQGKIFTEVNEKE